MESNPVAYADLTQSVSVAIDKVGVKQKKSGLHNSSQAGEKANNLVVSTRQKHKGMSWRSPGSMTLASVTALVRNLKFISRFCGMPTA